jgi:hypothetical protein
MIAFKRGWPGLVRDLVDDFRCHLTSVLCLFLQLEIKSIHLESSFSLHPFSDGDGLSGRRHES